MRAWTAPLVVCAAGPIANTAGSEDSIVQFRKLSPLSLECANTVVRAPRT